MWEDPHSLKRMWVTCVHNESMRRSRLIQHVEPCLVLSLWAGEDVGEMLILMSFVHHHQRSRIPLNKPTMSGSVCHMSFTATQDHIRSCKRENYLTSTQDGQLRPTVSNCILDALPNNQDAQGHHVWRHKRELYISLG